MSKCNCQCDCNSEPTKLQKKERRLRSRWLYYQRLQDRDTTLIGTLKRFASDQTVVAEKVLELEQQVFDLQAKLKHRGLPILELS